MKVEWHEYLSVGVEEIDSQHRHLFDKFNAMLASCERGDSADEINRLFAFLGAYVITHFSDEERLMQRLGFPDYPRHRDLHQAFTLQVAALKDRLINEGPTPSLVATLCLTINGWLIEHISGIDRAIGKFVKETKTQIP